MICCPSHLIKQSPASGLFRFLGSALLHAVPINRLPEIVQVLALAVQAKVVNVGVLPGADTKHRCDACASRWNLGNILAVSAVGSECTKRGGGRLVLLVRGSRRGVGVNALLAVAGFGERSAGGVSREDAPRALAASALDILAPDEPDETRGEHGGGGVQESCAEGVDGAESLDQTLLEQVVAIQRRGFGAQSLEEKVVVEGHAGVVEDRGALRVARVLEEQRLVVHPLVGLTGQQFIQLLHHHVLVGCPSQADTGLAEQAGDTVLLEVFVVDQLGNGARLCVATEGLRECTALQLLRDGFAGCARRGTGL
jgi:hypothetical protein